MDNVIGKGVKKRGKVVDMLLLLGTALLVAALSTGAALISEAYNISPQWLLSFWAGVGFLGVIGKTYGVRKLKSLRFAAFSGLASRTRLRVSSCFGLLGFPVLPTIPTG